MGQYSSSDEQQPDLRAERESTTAATAVAAGWYPDPTGALRFWDGHLWTVYAPPAQTMAGTAPDMQIANPRVIGIAALVVAVVGLVVNLQSVSVLTGDSITYVGLVVAVLAGVAAFVVKRVRLWMRIVVAIIVALCIVNTITVQVQLNHRQDQLSQIGAIGSALN